MRASNPHRTGIIEVGKRSIRKFFEHPISTYAAALAYRGLFGLFPFVLILVVLASTLGLADFLKGAIDQASSESSQHVPDQLEPVIERGKEQLQPLQRMIEQAEEQAGGELLFFGVALALWSISALAGTLTEAFNAVYEVPETRRWWKVSALSLAFGPILALMVIVSVGLMLIGPQLVERIAELVGLDEVFVSLWEWLRFPVALTLLAVVLSLVYRFGPRRQAALSLSGLGRGAGCGSVGDIVGWFLLLPGKLRQTTASPTGVWERRWVCSSTCISAHPWCCWERRSTRLSTTRARTVANRQKSRVPTMRPQTLRARG